jgi:integrase/recombinase XerD
MAGKQAKVLSRQQVIAALRHVRRSRYPQRDRVMILLSVKAGLRAGEIAKLTWPMLLDPDGRIANHIELYDRAAKKRSGRTIPLHPALRRELQRLRRHNGSEGAVIRSERGGMQGMRAGSIVNWFQQLYSHLGLSGCSSHSGRRTFITNAARLVFKAGGSLRDVPDWVDLIAMLASDLNGRFMPLSGSRVMSYLLPVCADFVEKVYAGPGAVSIIGGGRASPAPHAGIGSGVVMSLASFLRFWAVAARWNSSRAPFGPRNRRRSSFRMRLR